MVTSGGICFPQSGNRLFTLLNFHLQSTFTNSFYKIRCKPMHHLYSVLPESMCRTALHAVLWFMRLLAVPLIFIPSVSLWNNFGDHLFYGVGLAGFKSRANTFSWRSYSVTFCLLLISLSLFYFFELNGLNAHFWNKAYNNVRRACLVSLAPKREKTKQLSVWL